MKHHFYPREDSPILSNDMVKIKKNNKTHGMTSLPMDHITAAFPSTQPITSSSRSELDGLIKKELDAFREEGTNVVSLQRRTI